MRRRSGAIHSETQQQFVQLAEQSMNHTGIFYDEKFFQSFLANKNSADSQRKEDPFGNFDFNEAKQYQRDEEQLKVEMMQSQILCVNSAVICDDISEVLLAFGKSNSLGKQERAIDLIVRRETKNGQNIIFKYWIIEYGLKDAPLAESTCILNSVYISSARYTYWVSKKPCQQQSGLIMSVNELRQGVVLNENEQFKKRAFSS